MNRKPRMNAMTIKVMLAFRLRGSLKAVVPFEIASTPVNAVVPLEKACRSRNAVIPVAASPKCSMGGGSTTVPRELLRMRNSPVPTVISIMTIKK